MLSLSAFILSFVIASPAWAQNEVLEVNQAYELKAGSYSFLLGSDGRVTIKVIPGSSSEDANAGWKVDVERTEVALGYPPDMPPYYASGTARLSDAQGVELNDGLNAGTYALNLSNLDAAHPLPDDATATVVVLYDYGLMSENESESNDSPIAADLIEYTLFTMSGTVHPTGTSSGPDYFRYTTNVAGMLTVEFTGDADSNMSWQLEVFDESAASVSDAQPLGKWRLGTDGQTQKFQVRASDTGMYYVAIVPDEHTQASGSYKLRVSCTPDSSITMWRLYNPYTGEHLYTSDYSEYERLGTIGWKLEGKAWAAPVISGDPVWRLYNPYTDDHHYTTSKSEYDELAGLGWKQEGIGWYSASREDGLPIYRLYNRYNGYHHYTMDEVESIALSEIGWTPEGIGWYCYA
ncbi:hypothetical protein [Thermophilibacter provencensis]|uniref:DUF5648 domain-containing protein n=1 Tax=Thermophilibacter provencensis TaxID=1852386 RepID=A0ABT7V4P5_9ACTN|nr:hypothetical protein [Thermophilibacter provencensis]MDM8271574.1 hypothetical protein [Thermophilibacter provencensis]